MLKLLLLVLATFGFLVFLLDWLWKPKLNIPYPPRLPVIGHLLSFVQTPHMTASSWAETCGDVFCIQILNKCLVIVSGYDAAYEVLLTKGKDFTERTSTFRNDIVSENRKGILFQSVNMTWKKLRMLTHQKIKQYGEGLGHIEAKVHQTAQDLIQGITSDSKDGIIDPYDHIYLTMANNMTILMIGSQLSLDDPLFRKIVQMEELVMKCITLSRGAELDVMPWLRHFRNETFIDMLNYRQLRRNVFSSVKELFQCGKLPSDCLGYALFQETEIDDANARVTMFDTILAGVSTSAASLYIFLLLMATHPKVQMEMYSEIMNCVSKKEMQEDKILLTDRPNMPYTRACLLELLRYSSVASFTIDHTAVTDSEVLGHKIPKGTPVIVNLFGLHHSEKYWDKPWDFNPGRFLDEEGNLVASDHVNRKRLMAFGAGPRVCIGQSFASARLFILATSLIRAFEVTPAPGETIAHNPEKWELRMVLNAPRTRICLKKRP